MIYAHTTYSVSYTVAHSLLQSAIDKFLACIDESPQPQVLWYLHFDRKQTPPATLDDHDANIRCTNTSTPHILKFPDVDPGLVLEDDVLKHVRAAWRRIVGEDVGFLVFEEREAMGEEGIEDDEGET